MIGSVARGVWFPAVLHVVGVGRHPAEQVFLQATHDRVAGLGWHADLGEDLPTVVLHSWCKRNVRPLAYGAEPC